MANNDTLLNDLVNQLVDEFYLTDVLEALAAKAAREVRRDHSKKEQWKRARAMVLKAAAVTREIGM